MFGQPFVLQQLGDSGVFSNPLAMDIFISILLLVGLAAIGYGVMLVAKSPDRAPRVALRTEHRRRRGRKRPAGRP